MVIKEHKKYKKKRRLKKKEFTRYDLSESKVSIPTSIGLKKREIYFISICYLFFFVIELSYVDFHTYKRPQK